jgi:D-serine deaminase-like pyridoxal phosphate-dependent protein
MVTTRELPSPFLTVDLDVVDRNIRRLQRYCDDHGIALRPHVKTHKMPEIASRQLRAGAHGIACQKLGEAEVMADHGLDDILVTFPLVGVEKADRLAALAAAGRVAVGADSEIVASGISAALAAHGRTAGFLVDCDTGFGRTGVQSPREAADLAEAVSRLPGLAFDGLMTHPVLEGSAPWLREARRQIEQRGMTVGTVSGGGTPSAFTVHTSGVFTELRAGTYVYGDRRLAAGGQMSLEDCALRVLSTVVSRPTGDRAILDAGSKTLTSDLPEELDDAAYGSVAEYPDAMLVRLSEEHGTLDLTRSGRRPEVGERVTIIPNHACGVVNLHDEVALHQGGNSVEIVRILARGRVR